MFSQASKYRLKGKCGTINTCTEMQSKSKTQMCSKCSGRPKKRPTISSQSGGLHKAMEKATRPGIESRLGVSLGLCGVVMLMVLNGKLWLCMFRDKRQTIGGWGWVAAEQERGDTVESGERAWGPQKTFSMAGSEVRGSQGPYPATGGRCSRWVPAVGPGWAGSLSDSGRAAPGCPCSLL